MKTKLMLWSGAGAFGLVGAAGATWLLSLPPAPAPAAPPAIGKDEAEAILAGLKPPRRARPVVAIVGINHATELTDYLMPYGILSRANVADVILLATERGPVELFPALRVEPHATIAEFDAQHADGAHVDRGDRRARAGRGRRQRDRPAAMGCAA